MKISKIAEVDAWYRENKDAAKAIVHAHINTNEYIVDRGNKNGNTGVPRNPANSGAATDS